MSTRSPQLQDKYVLRLPDGMRDRLKQSASDNGRSLNAEIVSRLESSFSVDELIPRADTSLSRIERAIKDLKETTYEREKFMQLRDEMMLTILRTIANNGGKVPDEMAPLLQKLAGPIEGKSGE